MKPTTVLSLDVPWGGAHYVGAALATVDGQRLSGPPEVVVIDTARAGPADLVPVPIDTCPEAAAFLANGCGPDRECNADVAGPFKQGFPSTAAGRQAYVINLWRAFEAVRAALRDRPVDLVLVDAPLVGRDLMAQVRDGQWASSYRPVELAFQSKVLIPGASPARPDGKLQFAKFQGGILAGCRPGYALCAMAMRVFGAPAARESFPQLTIGPLSEYAAHVGGLGLVPSLAMHKIGNAAQQANAQAVLLAQVNHFLGCGLDAAAIPPRGRSDGYDALLGLLPGLVSAGFEPVVPGTWGRAVMLSNYVVPHPPYPRRVGKRRAVTGFALWQHPTSMAAGIDDSGVVALQLGLWP